MQTGLRDFDSDVALLTAALDEVIVAEGGSGLLELRGRAVDLTRRARGGDGGAGDELAELISGLDLATLEPLVRSLTRWFQLMNLAEDNERVRRIRARTEREAPAPRRGSVAAAVAELRAAGIDTQRLSELLAQAELRLVMTAHPTEARRRTTIDKQARVFDELRALDERLGQQLGPAQERIRATVQELWGSDEIRAIQLTVLDEVRGGLLHFTRTLVDVVPEIYRELEAAIDGPAPPLLRFGSWIGGDRDGNPFVTAEATAETLALMREQCLRMLDDRMGTVAGRISLSDRVAGAAPALEPILAHGQTSFPRLAEQLAQLNPEEPYRRALSFLRERVRVTAAVDSVDELVERGGYLEPAELLSDLGVVKESLITDGGQYTAGGDLQDLIRLVEVFGFHFGRLDIRQHAGIHRGALDEIFAELGIVNGYGQLGGEARRELLVRHIEDLRPLIPADIAGFSDQTQEVIRTFRAVHEARAGLHRGAIDAYVISGTEGPVDLLEVLLFMKETSLARAGGAGAALRIVPLFEAGGTLAQAPATMETLLGIPAYRAALAAAEDKQEIMIGYSDSNKDVGYVGSGWGTYRAQGKLVEVFVRHGLKWMFFHGRGGAVGRGGGPTAAAIRALPTGTVEGRLKMTEQGEVLNAKYTVREVAHRELELSVGATLVAGRVSDDVSGRERLARYEQIVEEMATVSERRYREVVHEDPRFVEFFQNVTPIDEVSRLRLGSRPARRAGSATGIDDLRAIPWVFSWTQARIILPAWLGLGTALAQARERNGLETLREMDEAWPFFRALIGNAAQACSKADPGIARRYVQLWDDKAALERIWPALEAELDLARRELAAVRSEDRLLDREPTLQGQLERRNPYVDPLSFIQIELLRRRRGPGGEDPELQRLSLLTINGIASGLRNTG
jgi:phosphoenolpyruvate carboxylase